MPEAQLLANLHADMQRVAASQVALDAHFTALGAKLDSLIAAQGKVAADIAASIAAHTKKLSDALAEAKTKQ